jgi:pimeloyl-ACP methyl ester carboxylesterase
MVNGKELCVGLDNDPNFTFETLIFFYSLQPNPVATKIRHSVFPMPFILSAHDAVCPLKDGRNNSLRWIPHAELHIIDSCGHMPHIEKTEEFDYLFFETILGSAS